MPHKEREKKNEYQRKYFQKGGPGHKKQMLRIKNRKKEIHDWIQRYKENLQCERCPESHPACLDFHHKDPKEKDIEISLIAVRKGWAIKRIMEEIEKCEILCANCHRKEHATTRR
jgi:hypothetical protein